MSDDNEVEEAVAIGKFTSSSGRVIICDGSYADLWREDAIGDDAIGDGAIELKVTGPDAFGAGMMFDLSSHPLYLYDVSEEMLGDLQASFEDLVRSADLDASLEPLDERIGHAKRVDLHFATGQPTHGIEFDGVWSGAADGLVPESTYRVMAQAFGDETEFAGRWRDVWIEVSDEPVATSELRGYAAVDCGAMLFIDPVDLPKWAEGGEAGTSTAYLSATAAIDRDPNDATTVPFGDTHALFFANRWGDGLFEIYADFDASGALARVRAAVGSERTQKRYFAVMRDSVESTDGPDLALVSRAVLDGAAPRFIYRAEPDHDRDSGWRILQGDESDDFLNDSDNVAISRLRDLLTYHESLRTLLDAPPGSVFERESADGEWSAVEDWEPV